MAGVLMVSEALAPAPERGAGLLLYLLVSGGAAGLVYLGALAGLRSEELAYTRRLVWERLGGGARGAGAPRR